MGEVEIDLTVLACSMPLYTVMQKIRTSKPVAMGTTRVERKVGRISLTMQVNGCGIKVI